MTAAAGEHPIQPPLPAPQAVVLDIGEVVIDETRVWSVWAELLGVSPFTLAAVIGAAVVQGESYEAAFPHVAPNIDWKELEGEHEQRLGGLQAQDLYRDARPCLSALSAAGLRVALCGNQPARRREQLAALDLPVDALATSEELGAEKPSDAFFAAVLELVGAEDASEVLYVGDRVDNDVLPAMAHGLRTCWLVRGPWGQLQEMPEGVAPDLVLEGLGELPELMAAWRREADEEAGAQSTSHDEEQP